MFSMKEGDNMNKLKELREKKGLTLKELSDALKEKNIKISPDSLAKYERGERKPKYDKLIEIAKFYGVPTAFLQGTAFSKNEIFEIVSKEYVNSTTNSNHFWAESLDKHLEIIGMKPLKKTFKKEELKNFSENVKLFFRENFDFVFLTHSSYIILGVEKNVDVDTLIKKDDLMILSPILLGFSDAIDEVDKNLISTSISDLFDKGMKRKIGNFYLGSDTFVRTASKTEIIKSTKQLIFSLNKFVEDVSKIPENKATSPEKARKRLNSFVNSGGKSFE